MRPRVGVSRCLLGEPVRWDGRDKRSAWLVEELGPQVEWVPICPELEVGMGVPREPVDLKLLGGQVHIVGRSGRDWTELFPSYRAEVRSLTVAPPLARRLGGATGTLYPLLARVPLVRSHLAGVLVKPGRP